MNSNARVAHPHWLRTFLTVWTGQQFSLLGSLLVQFALVWWVTEQSGSATVLATATAIALLPEIVLGPFCGALVDRWDRRVVMMVADSAVALFTAWLAFLFWSDTIQIWHVYVIMFARSVGGSFHWPAMSASTAMIVPGKQLSRIQGLNHTLMGARNIIGPPLGAMLIGVLPTYQIMFIDLITAAMAVVPLFFVRIPRHAGQDSSAPVNAKTLVQDVGTALRYVWSWKGLFSILIMASILNFLGHPMFSLMPLLVTQHLGLGAIEFGSAQSAMGLGMLAGGILLSVWGGFKRRIMTSMLGLVMNGLAAVIIGLTPSSGFAIVVGGMFILGLSNGLINGPFFAIVQDKVAPEMLGRVMMLIASLCGLASPLGLAIAGPLADTWGVPLWFIIAGTGTLVMGLGAPMVPAIYSMEDTAPDRPKAMDTPHRSGTTKLDRATTAS